MNTGQRRLVLWFVGVALLCAAPNDLHARVGSQHSTEALIDQAFHAAYNLDHDEAVELAEQAIGAAPDQSQTHRALASILWLNILFRRGAVTVDHYLGGLSKKPLSVPKPPADLDLGFKRELRLAIDLGEARLKQRPGDAAARYDVSASYALQASYTASVEGSMTSAFRSAKRAYDAGESVLEEEPGHPGALLIVGTYRYVISTLGFPSRLFAYIVGFGGGKERGIRMIEQSAAGSPEEHVEAATALMLIYSREGQHARVADIAGQLASEFPRNRLFLLEEGAASIRSGDAARAARVLANGMDAFEHDPRPKIPGERALWLYKCGVAQISLNRPTGAQRLLDEALGSDPVTWVRGRIHLELGKIADLAGRREDAVAAYRLARSISRSSNDPIGEAEAGRLLKKPFSMGGE
jgi:tetratricopeptide (TPR) repeat protein